MKIKLLLIPAAIFILSSAAFSQSVVITPKKTVYKRAKPESEYRKTFEITYPKVKAATPAVSRKIEAALSYEKNFEINLKEEINGEYQGLELADFEVGYNKNGVLSVSLFMEGWGAYPSSSTKWIVVDLKTGNRIKPAAVFTNLDGLTAKLKEIQQEKIKANDEELKSDSEYMELREDIAEELKDVDFTADNLEGFSLDEKGVTFHYDYGYRHAIRALAPDGEYFMSWAAIKPFIKSASLLGKFIR